MEPKKLSNGMALRRAAALRKGNLKEEDCVMISFLVGSEDSVVEEIRACKFDLLVASEYFQGLLRSPFTHPGKPIRIKHVDPDTFRLVVEFIHLTGQLVSKVDGLEQFLKLAAAADEFLLDELGQLCSEKLEKLINVDNVWTVFDKNHFIKYTSAICEKILSAKTDECLTKPAFLDIDGIALVKFLNLGVMNIISELQLVYACLRYISGKEDERALFRRCALPHLRLLTLSADDDLAALAPFLEKDEQMLLILNNLGKDSLQIKHDLLMSTTHLCKNTKPRNAVEGKWQRKEHFLSVPAELVDYRSNICEADYSQFRYEWKAVTYVWILEVISDVDKPVEFVNSLCGRTDDYPVNVSIPSIELQASDERVLVTITSKDQHSTWFQNRGLELTGPERYNLKQLILGVTNGGKVQVEVTINKTRKISSNISGPKVA